MGNAAQLVLSVVLAVLAGGWIAEGRLVMPALLGCAAVAAAGFAVAARPAYARLREPCGPLGITLLALLAGLPFTVGALAVGRPEAGTVPFVLAAWLQVLRVLMVDLEAEAEHRAAGRRTLVVRLGPSRSAILATVVALGFIPASFLLPARAGFGGGYFLVALFVALAVLVTAARVIVGRVDGSNVLLKGAMVMGAMAMVVGRVT